MELPENKSQLITEAAIRSARPVKLAVMLAIISGLIPYITVIIVNWQHSLVKEIASLFFAIIACNMFLPLVLTYFRFKTAYKECYPKESCPTEILKYIDKQRRRFVIVNICRVILLFGFLPEFPLYSLFRWLFNTGQYYMDRKPKNDHNANLAVTFAFFVSIVMLVLIMIFNAFMDLCIFRLRFGKLSNPDPCLRCGNAIEVDVTNLYCLYCRACEKLRKEVEKAHFLPNPQQKMLITSNTRPLLYAIALIKFAGPKMCPWCAQRPIVKQLESGEKGRECSKEDERRRQFESCEECLRM